MRWKKNKECIPAKLGNNFKGIAPTSINSVSNFHTTGSGQVCAQPSDAANDSR